jgi:hypothetical protein
MLNVRRILEAPLEQDLPTIHRDSCGLAPAQRIFFGLTPARSFASRMRRIDGRRSHQKFRGVLPRRSTHARSSMMRIKTLTLAVGAALTAASMTATHPVSAQNQAVEEFTAFAINTNTRPTGGSRPSTATLTITIERWSTDEERDQLMAIIKEQGSNTRRMNDALLSALQRLPRVGRIRETSSLGWDLHYARQASLDEGGRQIVLATDRPIPMWEARNQPRTFDYRFTFLDMRLDKANQGEGKMLTDTRLIVDRSNNIVLEHYDIQPVRLNQIRRRN